MTKIIPIGIAFKPAATQTEHLHGTQPFSSNEISAPNVLPLTINEHGERALITSERTLSDEDFEKEFGFSFEDDAPQIA